MTKQEMLPYIGKVIQAKIYALFREIRPIRFVGEYLQFETPHGRGLLHPLYIREVRIAPLKEGEPSDWAYERK